MSTDSKVYVGGLPADATSGELEDVFSRYGRLRKVWVARRPPGFAFIEFDDDRDAQDAVRALDGTRICGVRARVELSTGRRRGEGYRGGGRNRSRSPIRRRSRSPIYRRSRSRSPYYGRRSPSPRRSRSRSPRRSRSPIGRDSRSRSRSRSR